MYNKYRLEWELSMHKNNSKIFLKKKCKNKKQTQYLKAEINHWVKVYVNIK